MTPSADGIRRKVVLAGVGYSEIARSTGRSEGSLALEACRNAITDSGLSRDDIDGLAVWPDRISSVFEGPSITYMQRAPSVWGTRATGRPSDRARRSCRRSSGRSTPSPRVPPRR